MLIRNTRSESQGELEFPLKSRIVSLTDIFDRLVAGGPWGQLFYLATNPFSKIAHESVNLAVSTNESAR